MGDILSRHTRVSTQLPAIVPRPTRVSYGGNGVNAAILVYITQL